MANKKARMTNRERVEALLRREKPDRVPIWPFAMGFPMVYAGVSVVDAYNNPKVGLDVGRKVAKEFDWIFIPMGTGYAAFGGWEFGGEIKWPSGEFAQAPSVLRHAVETPEEAMKLKMPDVRKAGIIPLAVEGLKLSLEGAGDNEPFKLGFQLEGTFNVACNIPGADKMCKWMIKKPEVAHHLLRLATDYLVELALYYKELFGTDRISGFGGEPSASNDLISAKQFEEFALPYQKETNEKFLAMGFKTRVMHICGEQNLNLPYWGKIPMGDPGIVTFGHEVKLEEAAKYFPKDIIVGNLEPAIIQISTPEEVYEATRVVLEKGMNLGTGYFFAPGCELPPMAPVENVKAMNKAIQDHGWYD